MAESRIIPASKLNNYLETCLLDAEVAALTARGVQAERFYASGDYYYELTIPGTRGLGPLNGSELFWVTKALVAPTVAAVLTHTFLKHHDGTCYTCRKPENDRCHATAEARIAASSEGGHSDSEVDQDTLLERVQETQTAFWQAVQDLEAAVGFGIDATTDFADMTLEQIHDMEGEKA